MDTFLKGFLEKPLTAELAWRTTGRQGQAELAEGRPARASSCADRTRAACDVRDDCSGLRALEQVFLSLICDGAWPWAQRAAAGAWQPSCTCVQRGANDNGCGPISQPVWKAHRGLAGAAGCWVPGALGLSLGSPVPRAGSALSQGEQCAGLQVLSGLPRAYGDINPYLINRRTCGWLPALPSGRAPARTVLSEGPATGSRHPLAAWLASPGLTGSLLLATHSCAAASSAPAGCPHWLRAMRPRVSLPRLTGRLHPSGCAPPGQPEPLCLCVTI